MKKLLLLSAVTALSLTLIGCTDSNNNDIGAKKLLIKAHNQLQAEETYIETRLMTERVDKNYIQTEVTVRQPEVTDKETGSYIPNYTNKMMIGFPFAVKTKADLLASEPTRIVDETGDTYQEYYITEPEVGPVMVSENKEVRDEVTLKKDDVAYLLESAAVQETIGDIGIFAYTEADFYLKVLPIRLSNLVEIDTRKENGEEIIVLEGDVKGHKEESFLIYEKAKVEFWIEKESGKLVREVYRSKKDYEPETGAGELIFAYTYGKKFDLGDEKDMLKRTKNAFTFYNDDRSETELSKKTKADYLEVSGTGDQEENGDDAVETSK